MMVTRSSLCELRLEYNLAAKQGCQSLPPIEAPVNTMVSYPTTACFQEAVPRIEALSTHRELAVCLSWPLLCAI